MQEPFASEVLDTLNDLFDSVERLEGRGGRTQFRGTLVVAGHTVQIGVAFCAHFPLTLPDFTLEPWDALGEIPHVSPSGTICFLSPEGVVLDESRPGTIIRNAFGRMKQVLLDGLAGTNRRDFVDEFEACWSYLDPPSTFYLLAAPGQTVETLDVELLESGGGLVARNDYAIKKFFGEGSSLKQYRKDAVIFLPLQPGAFIQPPTLGRPFWVATDIRQTIVTQLSTANREALERLLRRHRTTGEFVLISLPRPKGGESVFGIAFKGIGTVHPLLASGTAAAITPIRVDRLDHGLLLGRGGASTALRQQKALVVGCGSLGGRIAVELSRTGIASLTLVDHDTLKPENTYRHVLGRGHWFKNKAAALKESLESQLPYIKVTAIDQTIEQAVLDRRVQFGRFEVVIFATGNPTVELRMNQMLSSLQKAPPAVYSWLEPLGIGGHALLVQSSSNGCFRCLFEDSHDPDIGLYNKAAFAAPGQSFGRALSGCGSLFTPFSSLDAGSTAVMAARLAVDALTIRETGNPLLSWKGDASEFTAEGFVLSDRFRRSDQHRFDHRYSYRSANCPICGSRNGNDVAADG